MIVSCLVCTRAHPTDTPVLVSSIHGTETVESRVESPITSSPITLPAGGTGRFQPRWPGRVWQFVRNATPARASGHKAIRQSSAIKVLEKQLGRCVDAGVNRRLLTPRLHRSARPSEFLRYALTRRPRKSPTPLELRPKRIVIGDPVREG
jgi:hypothetical protein